MVKQSIKFIVAGILATLFVTGATIGHAQNYPVQAFATLTPPYSLKLSDYAAPEGNRMRITLLLKDAQQPTLDVRLKLTIEGNGVKLTTNPSFQPTPITLLSSTLYEVSYDELSDYFLPQNLIADGISMSALTSSGMLPEGLYRFKVEAMEAHRDVPVSNTAMAIGWLMLNDPPQWISPRQGQKLTAGEPQGIQFLWTRCGMSSPNAALSTQYEVTMVEMVQPNMDPNVAIVTLPPIYQEVSPIENLFYGPDKPELIPGHSYAVRIQAFDTRGIDLYRNGGYSPVITFRYGDPCIAPVFLRSDNISEQTADLSWNSTPLATNYRVRFRENGTDLSDWYEEPATQTSYTVKNLKPDCTYEYQVQSECGSLPSDYSVSGTLRTRKLENQNQTCSEQLDNASMPTNRDPLSALHTNQTFLAGVMPVKVTSVQGSNGIFTGTGVVYLPIAGVGLSCTFNKVGINTNYQLISGEVITTKSKNTSIYGSGGVTVLDTLHLDNPIDTIIVNPNGDVAVVSGGDTTFIPLANQPVVIYPPTGGGAGATTGGTTGNGGGDGAGAGGSTGGGGTTTYGDGPLIVENGTVKPYNPAGDLPTALFHKASMSTYGYDSLAYEALRSYYPVATINGKEVGIPYKALPVSGSDNVVLELKPGSSKLTTDSLTIDVQTNAKVAKKDIMGNNRLMVTLQGLSEGEEPIMVRYTKHDADGKTEQVDIGAAKAVVYQPQPMKLVVVPLAGTTAPNKETLQSQLSAIYGQAVTSWMVTVTTPFAYTIPGGQLEFGSSEMASSYTEGMNNLIDAYKEANPSLEDGTYYLFVVPRFSDATLQGYMPRARRFGFIAQNSTDARTLAHELGHGAFNLEHTFPVLPQGTTDNLMDYNGGTRLIKPQWDLIHNPELTTGLLDDETDAASSLFTSKLSLVFYNDSGLVHKQCLYFLPAIMEKVKLVAKHKKDNNLEDIKVNWKFNDQEQKENTQIAFTVDSSFFNHKDSVQIDVTEKVILGADSTLTYFISKIDLSPSFIIDSVLMNIQNIRHEFDSLVQLLPNQLGPNMDTISLLGLPKYVNRGLSDYYDAPSGEETLTDFDKTIIRMYTLDQQIKAIEVKIGNIDQLSNEITTIYGDESTRKEFFGLIMENLITINPREKMILLEEQYRKRIIELTTDKLLERINNKQP